MFDFPFSFEGVNNPGDYESESITFRAEEDIDTLYDYLLIYSVEDPETGLPDYSKCRILTFDDIELQKGSLLEIYTRKGEDSSTIEFETAALNQILYWGLPSPIWNIPYSSFELSRRGDSIAGGMFND
ncbi:MAG: hypothetical protein HDQ88_12290 [Clostridia bacterium]|nr:hypothetical protein [Clostridia bacterium]